MIASHRFTDEKLFDAAHAEICPDSTGQWVVISGQYEPERVRCPFCGAEYMPVQHYFNADVNPEYDEDGRKIGSGEYQDIEFEGVLPLNV